MLAPKMQSTWQISHAAWFVVTKQPIAHFIDATLIVSRAIYWLSQLETKTQFTRLCRAPSLGSFGISNSSRTKRSSGAGLRFWPAVRSLTTAVNVVVILRFSIVSHANLRPSVFPKQLTTRNSKQCLHAASFNCLRRTKGCSRGNTRMAVQSVRSRTNFKLPTKPWNLGWVAFGGN